MIYWIDIADGQTGARYGTLRTAFALETTTLLDRAGSFRFALPAGDPQIDLLQVRRTAHVWAIVDDQVTELGAGVIEEISIAGDGAPAVTVAGGDLLRELAWQNVPDLWLADTVTEHAARVWFLDGDYLGTPNVVFEVTQATDLQEGDTTTYWQTPQNGAGERIWVPVEDTVGDFLYVAHLRQFDTIYFKRGPTTPAAAHYGSAYPEWHVQYYNPDGGWTDLSLTEQSSKTGTNTGYDEEILLGQSGTLSWEMPDDWTLQNPIYEVRIWYSGAATEIEDVEIADIAVGYTKPTADGLARIMAYAPTGWSLDAGSGYTATQPAQTVSAELLTNGGLETYAGTPDDGTTDTFTGWTNSGTDASNRIEATATAYSGSAAVKLVVGTALAPILSQTVTVAPLTDHLLTLWTRGDATAQLCYRLSDVGSGRVLTHWIYTGATSATWTQFTRRFAIPPNVTQLKIELSATVGTVYVDALALAEVRAGEVYLELAGESVLEALNRLAEQTGEHFVRGTGRTVRWLGFDERRLDLWLSNGGDANAKQDNVYAGHIVQLAEQQDGYELASRVYVYGGSMGDQRVTLATCTRPAPTGYALNVAENYIERSGVGYRRTDKLLELADIMPYDLSATALADAANALFDRALNWLQTHSATDTHRLTGDQPRAYTLEVAGCDRVIQPGYLVRVTYIDSADAHVMQRVDGWLWALGASLRIDANGVPVWTLQTATVDALARTEAEAQWTEARINRAIRRRGSLPLTASGGGVIIGGGVSDHAALTNLAYADSGHTGFQPTLAVSDTASVDLTLTGATLSAAVLPAGLTDFLLTTGARDGGSAAAQAFTNGIIGPSWKPAANATDALLAQTSGGATVFRVDTTNSRVSVGAAAIAPTATFQVGGAASGIAQILRANATTPGNLAQFQASDGTILSWIGSDGSAVFNEHGGASTSDFRIEGDTVPNLFRVDYSADKIGIGTGSPTQLLELANNVTDPGTVTIGVFATITATLATANNANVTEGQRGEGRVNAGGYNATAAVGSRGFTGIARATGATGTVTGAAGGYFQAAVSGGGTLTNAYGAYLATPSNSASTLTNTYGLYIEAQTGGGTSNQAIYTNAGLVRFGDQLSIVGSGDRAQLVVTGHTTQAVGTGLVSFTRNDAAAGVSRILQLTALGSGADGDGGSFNLRGKSSTTAAQDMAEIGWLWNAATHASAKADVVFKAGYGNGSTIVLSEWLRARGGAAPAIGVFAVTPQARPTAYTQTYATATRTHSNPTATTVTDTDGAYGFLAAADRTALVTAINALITDMANVKQVVNQVVDDLQGYGWLQ